MVKILTGIGPVGYSFENGNSDGMLGGDLLGNK